MPASSIPPSGYYVALANHWAHAIQPQEGEGRHIGHHAAHYLITLIAYAQEKFLLDSLISGKPLSLSNEEHERLTGYSKRHLQRLRDALERSGLIHVERGSWAANMAPQIYIRFEEIVRPLKRPTPDPSKDERNNKPEGASDEPGVATDVPHMITYGNPLYIDRSITAKKTTKIPESDAETSALADAAPVVAEWQRSKRCPPSKRRRRDPLEALTSPRDRQLAAAVVQHIRSGVSVDLLRAWIRRGMEFYNPEFDRFQSPWVCAFVWFAPWIERAVDEHHQRQRYQQQSYVPDIPEPEPEPERVVPEPSTLREWVMVWGRHNRVPASVLLESLNQVSSGLAVGLSGADSRRILQRAAEAAGVRLEDVLAFRRWEPVLGASDVPPALRDRLINALAVVSRSPIGCQWWLVWEVQQVSVEWARRIASLAYEDAVALMERELGVSGWRQIAAEVAPSMPSSELQSKPSAMEDEEQLRREFEEELARSRAELEERRRRRREESAERQQLAQLLAELRSRTAEAG